MDTLGTEIGQKMRSAVKAKLIELGTGSGSGYIDDELPDYVMIMVANKRSRQQMTDDLSLFLGAQTDVFVNWLHQVLQKLQEVTLPSSVASKKKTTEAEDKRKEKKRKDKKTKRRDRSTDGEEGVDVPGPTGAQDGNNTPPRPAVVPPGSSITEVFAHQYIEKAKKSMQSDSVAITKKAPQEQPAVRSKTPPTSGGVFDIPSITEIASAAVVRKHHKELCELEEIQLRINEAKRHLKSLGTDISDDDDEDLLHLKANEDDLETAETVIEVPPAAAARSNMTTDKETIAGKQRQRITIAPPEPPPKSTLLSRSTTPPAMIEDSSVESQSLGKKRSILDRLGTKTSSAPQPTEDERSTALESSVPESSLKMAVKPDTNNTAGSASNAKSTIISLSAHRREEREIYVPLFRRKEVSDEQSGVKERPRHEQAARGRSRERSNRATRSPPSRISSFRGDGNASRNRESNARRGVRPEQPPARESRARERSRSRERNRGAGRDRSASTGHAKNGTDGIRGRIGSRVIVPAPKPEFHEDEIEVPVASVIKIQPRPTVPKSKQPSKNLLLKAMAEAQRSTVSNLRKTIDNTGLDGNVQHYPRVEGKRKLLIEIPGAASIQPEMVVQYEDEDEGHFQLHKSAPVYGQHDEEDVHEVDITNQVLMEECDVDEEFKDILQGENDVGEQRVHRDLHHMAYEVAEDDNSASDTVTPQAERKDTKFVVTLDGAFTTTLEGSASPSHTPPPPSLTGGPAKGRLSVKDRIGYKEPSSSKVQSRRSPKPKDSKELEETLKKRKERFSEKLVASSTSKSPVKQSQSPPPPSASRGSTHSTVGTSVPSRQQALQRSPKAPVSSRSSHSMQSHSSSHRRTPSLSPERPARQRNASPLERPAPNKRAAARNSTSSPGHLNELLLQRTKELMDDSVSSSPIYMSKSDYDKMEPSSRKRKRVSPIQFDLTDEDDRNDSDDDYHRDRRARSRDERNPRRSRQRDSEERIVSRKESRREWERESDRRDSGTVRLSPGRKIKRLESTRKFDDLPPLLSAVSVSDGKSHKGGSGSTIKERCKYFPTCRQGDACEFLHPSTHCKAFPNCKFGDKCLYLHPMCKYDLTCHRLDCNFMHTKSSAAVSSSSLSAPPLASSVVPVQNYKTISAKPLPPLCKYYPNCVNSQCLYYHPKMCRFGRHCVNKVECNFYHYELPPGELHDAPAKDKFKWISPFSA